MIARREGAGAAGWGRPLRFASVCLGALLMIATRVRSMTLEVEEGEHKCVIISATKGSTINANYEVLGYPMRNTMVILRHMGDGKLLYRKQGLAENVLRADATEDGDYEMCFINNNKELMLTMSNKPLEKESRLVGLDALIKERREKVRLERQAENKKSLDREWDDDHSYSNLFLSTADEGYSDDWEWTYGKNTERMTFGFGLRLGEDVEDLEALAQVSEDDKGVARFLKEEADVLVQILSIFNDHESYMRGREEFHRENVQETSNRLMWCTLIEAAVLIWISWSQLSYIRRFFETKRVL